MKKAVGGMNQIIKMILNVMLFMMVILIFLQVIFRFIFESPLAWTEESARFLLVWITFLGAAYAMSTRAHIGIDVFVNLFPKKVKNVVTVISWLAGLIFFFILVYQGYNLAIKNMAQTSSTLNIPMGYIYYVIPISGLILIINATDKLVEDLKGEG